MQNYLYDKPFLKEIDAMTEKEQYIKIIVLDKDEKELEEIQGYVTSGGTLNINGDSSVRRTCTINMIADDKYRNLMDTSNLLSINKRIKIQLGFANRTNKYTDEEIIWFPLGIFIIMKPNISKATNGVSISLSLQDKMCLLNGTRGGIIPAYTIFDSVDEVMPDGNTETKKLLIYNIVQELVNHFGNIPLEKIIIKDLDVVAKEVRQWNDSTKNLWVDYVNHKAMILSVGAEPVATYTTKFVDGDDIGYHYTDFYFPEALTANKGDNVCTVLDKIKNKLGNFEYFFDVEGYFHFQEKKNYYNTSKATTANLENIQYITDTSLWQSEYDFNNSNLITSYQNSPDYDMVKNDFIIWGKRKLSDDSKVDIRYHLSIDKKPKCRNKTDLVEWSYSEEISQGIDSYTVENTVIKPPIEINSQKELPSAGYPGMVYHYKDGEKDIYVYWSENKWVELNSQLSFTDEENSAYNAWKQAYDATVEHWEKTEKELEEEKQRLIKEYQDHFPNVKLEEVIKRKNIKEAKIYNNVKITDWRTELYLQGCESERFATDSNYYYAELINEWGKIYDIPKSKFKDKAIEQSSAINYFLDFIESGGAYNSINISDIGRLTKVVSDDTINCIFEPIIEDYVFCYTAEEVVLCEERGQPYINVSSLRQDGENAIEANTISGGTLNSAYNLMKDLIYEYTNYNESITLQCLPIYYLEPNTIITVEDSESLISGEYVINTISVPMDLGGTMSITAKRVTQRR